MWYLALAAGVSINAATETPPKWQVSPTEKSRVVATEGVATQPMSVKIVEPVVISPSIRDEMARVRDSLEDQKSRSDEINERRDRDTQRYTLYASISQAITSIVGMIGLFITIFVAVRAWREAQKTAIAAERGIHADTNPFLYLEFENGPSIRWRRGKFVPKTPLFRIINAGKGPAVVTRIGRRWEIRDLEPRKTFKYPDPVNPNSDNMHPYPAFLPIAPGDSSKGLDAFAELIDAKKVNSNSWIMCYGYIEFMDLENRRYVSGFFHLYRMDKPERGMHLGFPEWNFEKYNYQHEVTDPRISKHAH